MRILIPALIAMLIGCTSGHKSNYSPKSDTMKIYWNDQGQGVSSDEAIEAGLQEAYLIWSDEVRGIKGNFLGLIDNDDRTIQFYFTEGIPDHIEDASHLNIVLLDIPVPERQGSYQLQISIGEVNTFIEKAYQVGAYHKKYERLSFLAW